MVLRWAGLVLAGGPNQILLKVKMTLLAVLSVKAIHVSACQCINPSEDL